VHKVSLGVRFASGIVPLSFSNVVSVPENNNVGDVEMNKETETSVAHHFFSHQKLSHNKL